MWRATRALSRDTSALAFGAPVACVYNPLEYAAHAHREYVRRFASAEKRVLFVGMNPGPFGMAQTGVPFGEVSFVRDWLGIEAKVGRPAVEHPKRPIDGFACQRSEVSGARLWGAVAAHWKRPERFFAEHYVANYCPLLFMEESGRNRTPDKLPRAEREPLFAVCDAHLTRLVRLLKPDWLLGIGAFAAARAAAVAGDDGPRVGQILHPSPASPLANRGWAPRARRELRELGVCGARGR